MSFPSRIGIATSGYRTGSGNPGRICIATAGYRCPEVAPAPSVSILAGDGGVGIQRKEAELLMTLAPSIVTALEELEQ